MRRLSLLLVVLAAAPAHADPPPAKVGPDVPPQIPASFYKARRDKLAARLGGCVGVIKAYEPEDDMPPIDPYFYYLTGIDEVGTVLTLAPREPIYKASLDLTPRDPENEIWEGYREPLSIELRNKYMVDRVSRV